MTVHPYLGFAGAALTLALQLMRHHPQLWRVETENPQDLSVGDYLNVPVMNGSRRMKIVGTNHDHVVCADVLDERNALTMMALYSVCWFFTAPLIITQMVLSGKWASRANAILPLRGGGNRLYGSTKAAKTI